VTNLQLTQATLRSREIAVRRAIGAGRGRLLRQFAAEGVILGLAGGLGGIGLAWGGTKVLGRYHLNVNMPLADAALRLDPPVIGLACSLSLCVGIACALLPALRGSGRNLAGLLHGSLTSGSSGARLRASLVTLQIAISFVVLVAAGLLVRTLLNLQAIDPGFDAEAVATVSVDLELDGFDETAGPQVVAEALGRIRQAPGTIAVAAGDSSPFTALSLTRGLGFAFARLDDGELPAGHPDAELGATLLGLANVTPDYFRTLGVPVLAGRPFRDTDDAASPPVVIVSSVLAESLWPGQSPVGRHLRLGREGEQLVEVVGVAGDLKRDLTRDAASWIYKPLAQSYSPTLTFFVRGAEPGVALREMQGALLEVEPLLTLFAAGVLADYVDESLWETRLFAGFVGLFGVLALLVAAAGLYGVLAHTVAQRSREMGVRIALGASVSDIASWVGRKSAVMVASGTVIGGVAALWATRFLESRFHGVEPDDPLTFASTFVLLGVVAVLACVVPVSRATNVDPVVVLRDE
jgi:putative ABC transport system permease protein